MNFQRANHKLSLLEDFYNCFNEDTRLKRRHGIVEYTTNMKYIHEYLNDDKTKSINNLCNYIVNDKRIIGKTNIERLFVFLTKYRNGCFPQTEPLFIDY